MTKRGEALIARLTSVRSYTAADLERIGKATLTGKDGPLPREEHFVLVRTALRDEIVAALRGDCEAQEKSGD